MKQFFASVFVLFFTPLLSSCNTLADPLLVIVLMVKNEEAAMQPTLQPFINAGIQSYLILDTGSTDNTIKVTQELFKKHTITQGYIVEQPFVDFATSRNYALQCTEEKFPNAAFFLMIDAEWIMNNVPDLISFCSQKLNSDEHSYLIRGTTREGYDFFVQRLIRPKKNLWYKGVVHETFNQLTQHKATDTIFFTFSETYYGMEKSNKRALRDCELLHKNLEKNPRDGHAIFCLGQTYHLLGNHDEAIKYYKMYCSMALPDEFSFMVHCRLGELYQQLGNWNEALYYYLEAYNIRPSRAEPLTHIAGYYLTKEQFALSFFFANKAINLPYPKDDIFLINKDIYEYARYDILGKAAYCVGEYTVGETAIRQAVKARPHIPELHSILDLYLERKNHIQEAQ